MTMQVINKLKKLKKIENDLVCDQKKIYYRVFNK